MAGGPAGASVDRIGEVVAAALTPERALVALQVHLLREFRHAVPVDALVWDPRRFFDFPQAI